MSIVVQEGDAVLCEECGDKAVYIVERRVVITNLKTNESIEHPEDAWEASNMTDALCRHCFLMAGFTEEDANA